MFWPHTKTSIYAKIGSEIFNKTWKFSLAKHKATLTAKFLSYIITPP
jgi:hypothetical protein